MAKKRNKAIPTKRPWTKRGRFSSFMARLFCKRNIIIISEHKTAHLPVHPALQFIGLTGAVVFITWASYSTGSYMAAQQVLQEKERKLAFSQQENERIGTEFALLKRDLSKLMKGDKSEGVDDEYAQMVAKQYDENGVALEKGEGDVQSAQNAILTRIEYLENRVKDLQTTHDEIMADIRATTGGKIQELEQIITRTGVGQKTLVQAAEQRARREAARREKYGRAQEAVAGRGGPFVPVSLTGTLKEQDTQLYFNLRRLMVLNEVVGGMPLARPMGEMARLSSGFGRRIDPFNGRLAMHTGLDFVGMNGARVLATADGKVESAGWRSGYGKAIDIDHEFGFSTRYGHLSHIMVKPGQHVKKGQTIGVQGSTGRSTGAHLHYEVRYYDRPLNPRNFVTARRDSADDVR
jgi:murein DD-endopeptidase MepM/ murein hydrolase activator NlpD